MRDWGYEFAGRYFGPGTWDKHASAAECANLDAHGMSIFALAEGWEDGALDGYHRGVEHATSARDGLAAVGAPGDAPIYFAVDFDWQNWQWQPVAEYFQGAADVIGRARVGIYGGIRVVDWAAEWDVARWFFQTYAWSGGQWSPHNHVEQYNNGVWTCGGRVDQCRSVKKYFGQWRPGQASTPSGGGEVSVPATDEPVSYNDSVDHIASAMYDVGVTHNGLAQVLNSLYF